MTKCIISEDKDGIALLDKLRLNKFTQREYSQCSADDFADMHRTFHYHVVKWLQDQGFKVP